MKIKELAKRFGLSRSTLLYYDSIGLLVASSRTEANYRIFSENDIARMELIELYRKAGLPLRDIKNILDGRKSSARELLNARLRTIHVEIQRLRHHQSLVMHMLQSTTNTRSARILNKERWKNLLRATGLSATDMDRWHIEFERLMPQAHQDFLESLGIEAAEVKEIRKSAARAQRRRRGDSLKR